MNFNDMKPSQNDIDWIKERYDVTYILKQFSGASWWPLCYDNYSEEEMGRLCEEFKNRKIVDYFKLIDRLEFSYNNFSPSILKGWDKPTRM